MTPSTILIIDDHHVVIEGIKSALEDCEEFMVVSEAMNGRQALDFLKTQHPDIVILDISMPDVNGIEVARQIQQYYPGVNIVVYTMHSDKALVVDLFKSGISAYVLKDDPLSDLILALQAVRAGGTYFSTMAPSLLLRHMEELEEQLHSDDPLENLSRREREVFLLLAEGGSVKEIADRLHLSPKTVETHKYHIFTKLDCSTPIDLTKLALSKRLIEI